MTSKSGARSRLEDLEKAVALVLKIWPEQFCPLEDLCEAMRELEAVYNRKVGAPGVSHRQQEIVDLFRAGVAQNEIARRTGLSRVTVNKYLKLAGEL